MGLTMFQLGGEETKGKIGIVEKINCKMGKSDKNEKISKIKK